MDSSSLYQQSSHHWTMDEEHGGGLDMVSSSSDVSSVVVSSDDSDVCEEVNSSGSSSPRSPDSSSGKLANGSAQDLSSLLQQLPFKRGLSKHYNGKSQSFTSLANVKCLEDLAKPENPYNKRLKSCKSYALFESHRSSSQPHRSTSSSRLISDKASRGFCSPLSIVQRNNGSFLGNRPPFPPPHRSPSTSSFANQTPLFA